MFVSKLNHWHWRTVLTSLLIIHMHMQCVSSRFVWKTRKHWFSFNIILFVVYLMFSHNIHNWLLYVICETYCNKTSCVRRAFRHLCFFFIIFVQSNDDQMSHINTNMQKKKINKTFVKRDEWSDNYWNKVNCSFTSCLHTHNRWMVRCRSALNEYDQNSLTCFWITAPALHTRDYIPKIKSKLIIQ